MTRALSVFFALVLVIGATACTGNDGGSPSASPDSSRRGSTSSDRPAGTSGSSATGSSSTGSGAGQSTTGSRTTR